MLRQDDTYLAALIFHELAHQRVYVSGNSAFNEAFAVAVETTGVKKWLRQSGNLAGLRRYEADNRRSDDFHALVAQARSELARIYGGSACSTEQKADGEGGRDRTAAQALPADARQDAGAATGDTMPGSTPRSTTQSLPRRRSTAIRSRRSCACSTCVRATIRASTRRSGGSAHWTRISGTTRSRPRMDVQPVAGPCSGCDVATGAAQFTPVAHRRAPSLRNDLTLDTLRAPAPGGTTNRSDPDHVEESKSMNRRDFLVSSVALGALWSPPRRIRAGQADHPGLGAEPRASRSSSTCSTRSRSRPRRRAST